MRPMLEWFSVVLKDRAIADAFTSASSVLEQREDGSDLSINIASCTQVRTLACDDWGGSIGEPESCH